MKLPDLCSGVMGTQRLRLILHPEVAHRPAFGSSNSWKQDIQRRSAPQNLVRAVARTAVLNHLAGGYLLSENASEPSAPVGLFPYVILVMNRRSFSIVSNAVLPLSEDAHVRRASVVGSIRFSFPWDEYVIPV